MSTMNAEALIELGKELESARTELLGFYDDLGADYESDAAKQFYCDLEDADDGDLLATHYGPFRNTREDIWQPTVGGLHYYDDRLRVRAFTEEVQPEVLQAAELLDGTRDATETLATMTGEDLEALASIPTALGQANEILAQASGFMEDAANDIGEIRNALNSSSWHGSGRDAYFNSLTPQEDAFTECQTNTEAVIDANTALGKITADLMNSFLSVRKEQLEQVKATGSAIFTLVNPGSWLDIAQEIFDQATEIEKKHIEEFQEKIEELANSAENYDVIEGAERTVGMTWPAPLSGIGGGWDR